MTTSIGLNKKILNNYHYNQRLIMVKYALLCFIFSLAFADSQAQSAGRLKSTADQYYESGKYTKALPYYLKYQEQKKGDADVMLRTGVCQYFANDMFQAKKYLTFVKENEKNPEPLTYLFLAKTLHSEHKFKEAAKHYKTYLSLTKSSSSDRGTIRDDIRRCATGMKVKVQEKLALVENLGEKVNSSNDDFAPILSPNYDDKLYFSSARRGNLGGLRDKEGKTDEIAGDYSSDMFSTKVVNGEWSDITRMTAMLNTPRHDMILDFSQDGSVMYFYKGFNLYSGEIFVDTFKSAEERSLFPSKLISPMKASEGDGMPHFFNDSTLVFSSRRAGGYGGSDLYFTVRSYQGWTRPQNLGASINSAYDETTPFLAKDGRTLYFSSNNSRKSIGGHDIFKSTYNVNKNVWSEPKNMGLPINSARDDAFFKLSHDGLKAYFSSDRKESTGMQDLFIAYFKGKQKEQTAAYDASLFFTEVERKRQIMLANTDSGIDTQNDPTALLSQENIPTFDIAPLYYASDDDVLNTNNIRNLNTVVSLLSQFPSLSTVLTCHNDEEGPIPFNLYFTIKRAEQAAEYLTNNGVNASRILLKGVGTNYPIAQSVTNTGINQMGKKLNQRIDIAIIKDKEELPLKINLTEPEVSKFIANNKGTYFNKMEKGLYYKVQIASIKQLYNGDLINQYPDAMVEKESSSQLYRYTIGMYRTYYSALQLKKELISKGYTDNYIIPYVQGKRITSIYTAKNYIKKYPDIKNYINSNMKK